MEFTLHLAGQNIGVHSRGDRLYRTSQAYQTDAAPDFTVCADEAGMALIRSEIEEEISDGEAEYLALLREMAERMACRDRALIHGAAVEYRGQGYLFCAPSGTGKSTHISLWRELLGDAMTVVNGDKPFLWKTESALLVCGSPYAGKEGWGSPQCVPLAAVCILSRGAENRIRRIPPKEAFVALAEHVYYPRRERRSLTGYMAVLRALAALPCYALECNISKEAAALSIAAMTGALPEQDDV